MLVRCWRGWPVRPAATLGRRRTPRGEQGEDGVMISSSVGSDGVAEIVMDNPPVNALPAAGWFELARALREAGNDAAVRVVILRAEGRGFNAGVDIKELQAS